MIIAIHRNSLGKAIHSRIFTDLLAAAEHAANINDLTAHGVIDEHVQLYELGKRIG